jgi:hypothetical protein
VAAIKETHREGALKRAPPGGYTLLLVEDSVAINATLYKKPNYKLSNCFSNASTCSLSRLT